MKKSGIVVSLLLGFGLLSVTSCGKSTSSANKAVIDAIEVPKTETKADTTANHNVKAVNLRQAENFAVFANTSILSVPSSTITGKVGLRPGIRSQITLDPTEVVGGLPEIYAGDDRDVGAAAFIMQAKIDMINAYNEEERTVADADKIGLWNGNLGNKVLAAGVYEWKSRVTIPLDLKLEGNETDVWIFKVTGQLRVGTDVHVTLSGGAKASNVFWQVGDDVLIRARSSMVGTIISQQTFEMKEQASLVGRAFVKNDKLVLNKNTITKP
ncbi:MAG: DUF3494 domain-containing protein [Bacteriovorax sp.]|nr:DUF3494 domain-containing protein [Bacteriovorax sp.]